MEMSTLVAVVCTLAIFSFLYRDNPFYRMAEHILIGLSVGFTLVMLYNSVLVPKLLRPLFLEVDLWGIIPLLLGLTMLARMKRSLAKFSKPALALMIGSGAGLSIPAMFEARILRQLAASVEPFAMVGRGEELSFIFICSMIISLIGVISAMVYFFYTRPDTKLIGSISRTGVYFLMIFFGATFGYTVTSRLTLLIGRMEFLLGDFLSIL